MKYLALLIRIAIFAIWVSMIINNPEPHTPPFCSWIVFILLAIYLGLLSMFWQQAMTCPLKKCFTCTTKK